MLTRLVNWYVGDPEYARPAIIQIRWMLFQGFAAFLVVGTSLHFGASGILAGAWGMAGAFFASQGLNWLLRRRKCVRGGRGEIIPPGDGERVRRR